MEPAQEVRSMTRVPRIQSPASLERLVSVLSALAAFFLRFWEFKHKSYEQDQLTYPQVVQYFIEHQPQTVGLGGALLRQRNAIGWKVSFLYLDGNGQICKGIKGRRSGRTVRARELDQELLELFGDQDLILFR